MERSSHNHHHHHHHLICPSQRLENIDEEGPTSWLPGSLPPPETPTETMEFLARSWSLSAMELSKALHDMFPQPPVVENTPGGLTGVDKIEDGSPDPQSAENAPAKPSPKVTLQTPPAAPLAAEASSISPPISPTDNGDIKILRGSSRGKTMGGWLKDQKEKKRAELRSRNAQIYAATSVAGVAASVAAMTAGNVFLPEVRNGASKTTAAIASAAALVASHCVEMAQAMGASRDQILTVIRSAVSSQTSGDIMALTAGAATALRGAATLRARLHKDVQGVALSESKESALAFVTNGGDLLKRTRKGDLHWKQVSVYPNSNWQVVVKMKSTHIAGTFVKKKKSVVTDVSSDIPAWPGREAEDGTNQRAYFGIKTPDRLVEFECRNEHEKRLWIEGVRQMLSCHKNTDVAM